MLRWRRATQDDAELLATMNVQLIRDEGHRNEMTRAQLTTRMQGWLRGAYRAILFESEDEVVGYALIRGDEYGRIQLRQFFIAPARRRRGLGREAFGILQSEVLEPGARIVVEVLHKNETAIAFWKSIGFDDYAITLELTTR